MHFPLGPVRSKLSCLSAQKTLRVAQEGLCAGIHIYIQHIDGPSGLTVSCPGGSGGRASLGLRQTTCSFVGPCRDDPPQAIPAQNYHFQDRRRSPLAPQKIHRQVRHDLGRVIPPSVRPAHHPIIYYRPASTEAARRWWGVTCLQGGGLCYDAQGCQSRAGTLGCARECRFCRFSAVVQCPPAHRPAFPLEETRG